MNRFNPYSMTLISDAPQDHIQVGKNVIPSFQHRRVCGFMNQSVRLFGHRERRHTCYLHNFFHQACLHFAIRGRQVFVFISELPHFFRYEESPCVLADKLDVTLVLYSFRILRRDSACDWGVVRSALPTFFVRRKQYPYVASFSRRSFLSSSKPSSRPTLACSASI
jgi:hypothetical protein